MCYPELTSTSAGELSCDVLWQDLAALGLRPVARVALDDPWFAMRLKVIG